MNYTVKQCIPSLYTLERKQHRDAMEISEFLFLSLHIFQRRHQCSATLSTLEKPIASSLF